jgi:hypothetical protein
MKTRGRLTVVAGLIVLVIAGTYGGVRVYKLWHLSEWHARILHGDSEDDVRAKMGSADLVVAGPRWCEAPATVRSFMYGHSFPPEWWIVELDGTGRVTCTVYVQSP